jgi:hypothetical protein
LELKMQKRGLEVNKNLFVIISILIMVTLLLSFSLVFHFNSKNSELNIRGNKANNFLLGPNDNPCGNNPYVSGSCHCTDNDYDGYGVGDISHCSHTDVEDCDDNDAGFYPGSLPRIRDIESLDFYLDPEYVSNTRSEREFTPTAFTPFDNFIAEVTVKTCPDHSDPDWENPSTLDFVPTLTVGDIDILTGDSDPLRLVEGDESSSEPTYQWKITGWQHGIIDETNMNYLISSIKQNDPIYFKVTQDEEYDEKDTNEYLEWSNCVHLIGNDYAPWKITSMRTTYRQYNPMSAYSTIQKTFDIKNAGFDAIDPFKYFCNNFAYYTDLDIKSYSLNNLIVNDNVLDPQCTQSSIDIIMGTGFENAYTKPGGRNILFDGAVIYIPPGLMAIHEMGHAIAGLADERIAYPGAGPDSGIPKSMIDTGYTSLTNCVGSDDLSHYRVGAWTYGSLDLINCIFANWHRPTSNTIMRGGLGGLNPIPNFDVIGCGYVAKAITFSSADARTYWWDWCNRNSLLNIDRSSVHLS